jgi:hypothetical protein
VIAKRRNLAIGAMLGALFVLPAGAADDHWSLLSAYCTECHNATDWAGSVAFDTMTPEGIADDAKVWESAVRKLRGHLMPPPGSPQPKADEAARFVTWMEGRLDANTAAPRAGHVGVQRLNRDEYQAEVKALLGVDIKAKDLLPSENEVEGFNNIAAALSVSPAFLDQYIDAARVVARLAVGSPTPKMANAFHAAPPGLQDTYVDGFPPGTRGGLLFRHNFPLDGEYRFNLLDLDVGLYPASVETRHTVVVLVDRKEVFRGDLGGSADLNLVNREGADGRRKIFERFQNIPAKVTAGNHEVIITFIERSRALTDETISGRAGGFGGQGGPRGPRLLDGVQVVGPFGDSHLSRTATRAKIFDCTPTAASQERACAETIAEQLARRAYRRPVGRADVEKLMPFYETGRKQPGGFDAGIEQVVAAVLSSPDFLYRAIRPASSGTYALTDLELASRLSFFLWGQGPDDALLDLATRGGLRDRAALDAQVRRMLADPRAQSLVDGFALKWLNLDELEQVDPDPRLFPGYTSQLREDFAQEIRLFLKSVLLGNQSVVALLDSPDTWLNERLARHYGVKGVYGPQFRPVRLEDARRFGILGKGAMLLRTSYGDRTSPVLRGAWVLERLMGTPPTPPPPGVETNLSTPPNEQPKTIRARLEVHRANQSCNQCHGVIDPIGLALENFDTVGAWRDTDRAAQAPIDATTRLPDGTAVSGVVDLRADLTRKPEQFVQSLTKKLLMYATGREVEYFDMPQVRAIVRDAAKDDYRLGAIVLGVVSSDAFRLQSMPHDEASVSSTTVTATRARQGE